MGQVAVLSQEPLISSPVTVPITHIQQQPTTQTEHPPSGGMQASVATQPIPSTTGSTATALPQNTGYAAEQVDFYARLEEPLKLINVEQELTRGTYKRKFHNLLCWEEKAHIEILQKR